MNNKDFITELAQKTGMTQAVTQTLVRTIIDTMGLAFEENNSVAVQGFGTFDVKKRNERVMVNPSTQQRLLVPPKLVLNFKPTASIKEQLKNGGDNE